MRVLSTLLRNLLLIVCCSSQAVNAGEWNSNVVGEWLVFTDDALYTNQKNSYLSAAIETEYFHEWNGGDDLFVFKPFYRVDQYDDNRTHGDIRELSWLHASNDWELLVGISKVYWGATEAAHLVDIINQTDFVENLDGEDKLGQPMIKLTFIQNWGVTDFFVLPGFRERTFPAAEGRPRIGAIIDTDNVAYQSSDKEKHIDYAVRWSDTLGDWDVGLAYFKGTAREPTLKFIGPTFQPFYEIIGQTSIDVQSSIESWLFKLELISRVGQSRHFIAAATGVEYTFVGVNESQVDVGVIVEYLYDERDTVAFHNDVVVASRIAMNDAESSELLISLIVNLDGNGQSFNIEAARRIGNNMKISIEARGVINSEPGTFLSFFENDNRVRTELTYYFE